ncbi:MAG: FAD-dependent oxidoreductase [Casimicrobiaceae bacterium]
MAHLDRQFQDPRGATVMCEHARLAGRDGDHFVLAVGDKRVTATQVVLDTGTRNRVPPIEGTDDVPFIDADHWLEHDTLPHHLLIVGAGYVELEMSQFYRRMGAEVTVVHTATQIAEHEDSDVAEALQGVLEREGIRFMLGHRAKRFAKSAMGVQTTVERDGEEQTIESSHLFLAVGRKPNTDDLGLDAVGVVASDKGIVEVDKRLATMTPGIWAAGDIRGGPMFTHTSWDDYRILASQFLGDRTRTTDRVVPFAVFTDPELGRVGMSERQARKSGRHVRVGHFEMSDNGKAREIGETSGFCKVVIDTESEQILGAAVLAVHGGELVHLFVDLMNARARYGVLRDAIHIHPTLAEAMQSAVAEL